jgi:hypothetical protein
VSDPALTVLLIVLAVLIFGAEPLAAKGFALPVVVLNIASGVLVVVIVCGSRHPSALIVVTVAALVSAASSLGELFWSSPDMSAANALGGALGLVAMSVAVSRVVFGPGRITAHRVRGAILLYLALALIYAWLYRLIALLEPGAFTGLDGVDLDTRAPFIYYSLTTLTTLGFGDIVPIDPFARSLTMSEALAGQLYPAVILARMLTLYAGPGQKAEPGQDEP